MLNKLTAIATIITIIFTGCSTSNQNISKKTKKDNSNTVILKLDKPIEETKIFIDNSLDKNRNIEIMNIVYKTLKEGKIKSFDLHDGVRKINPKLNYKKINLVKVHNNTDKYLNYCLTFCDEKPINVNSIKRVDDGIIIEDIKTDTEILSAYKELSWEFFNGEKEYNITKLYGIQVPLKLESDSFENNIFKLNDKYLNDYSIKNMLEQNLGHKGFILTKNKEEADYIFVVENLGFGEIGRINKYIKTPSNLNNGHFKSMGELGLLAGQGHISGGGSASSGGNIAAGMMAFGLVLNLLDNSGDFIYTFNRLSIIHKNKVLKNAFINTKKVKGKSYVAISDEIIELTNHKASEDFVKNDMKIFVNNVEVVEKSFIDSLPPYDEYLKMQKNKDNKYNYKKKETLRVTPEDSIFNTKTL